LIVTRPAVVGRRGTVMSFWTLCHDFLFPSPATPVEIDPMPTDLSAIPQNITDDLTTLQDKFNRHQSANAAVMTKQAALATAQAELNSAVMDQQQTGQAVHDALTKLTTDIASDYADPEPEPTPAPKS